MAVNETGILSVSFMGRCDSVKRISKKEAEGKTNVYWCSSCDTYYLLTRREDLRLGDSMPNCACGKKMIPRKVPVPEPKRKW